MMKSGIYSMLHLFIAIFILPNFLLSSAQASFVDTPPMYRGLPNSVEVAWNRLPDGSWSTGIFSSIAGGYPLDNSSVSVGGDAASGWVFSSPNFIDNLPLKRMRIQVGYSGQWDTSSVTDVNGYLDNAGTMGTSTMVGRHYPLGVAAHYFYEDWEIRPNPINEKFFINVPQGVTLTNVKMDSISVPIPNSAWLLSVPMLLGMGYFRRQCDQR